MPISSTSSSASPKPAAPRIPALDRPGMPPPAATTRTRSGIRLRVSSRGCGERMVRAARPSCRYTLNLSRPTLAVLQTTQRGAGVTHLLPPPAAGWSARDAPATAMFTTGLLLPPARGRALGTLIPATRPRAAAEVHLHRGGRRASTPTNPAAPSARSDHAATRTRGGPGKRIAAVPQRLCFRAPCGTWQLAHLGDRPSPRAMNRLAGVYDWNGMSRLRTRAR